LGDLRYRNEKSFVIVLVCKPRASLAKALEQLDGRQLLLQRGSLKMHNEDAKSSASEACTFSEFSVCTRAGTLDAKLAAAIFFCSPSSETRTSPA
jgi:hypothetical protein